jgi:hypothetical protein
VQPTSAVDSVALSRGVPVGSRHPGPALSSSGGEITLAALAEGIGAEEEP